MRITYLVVAMAAASLVPSSTVAAQAVDEEERVILVDERDPELVRTEQVTGTRPNWETIGAGLVGFGLAYGAAVIGGAVSDNPADDDLYIPVAGPWMAIAERDDCPPRQERCDDDTLEKVLIGIDGALQAAGLLTATIGVLTPVTYTVTTENARLELSPLVGPHASGLQLSGSF